MTGIRNPIVEILAVGSELLSPYYQDTNSLYLTKILNSLGINITYKSIVGDEWQHLIQSFHTAFKRAEIIIVTGGLGPTRDDRTREACAAALGRDLLLQEDLLNKINERFKERGMPMPEVNKKQAYVISGAEALPNNNGTAPGIWLDIDYKILILLPGPPREAFPMFESEVIPRLEKYRQGYRETSVLKISGLTESKIEALISDLHPQETELSLTILAKPGQIELHTSGYSSSSQTEAATKVGHLESRLQERLKLNIFSRDGRELEEVVAELLLMENKTIATAESCTGGLLGHRITNVPGSSQYYIQGVQAYSNSAKGILLGVPDELLADHGAVSSEVAASMAAGIREKAEADFGLAITGIAGPGGGTPEKPVGLVYTTLAFNKGLKTEKNVFLGDRETIKFRASQKALDMLRLFLLAENRCGSTKK